MRIYIVCKPEFNYGVYIIIKAFNTKLMAEGFIMLNENDDLFIIETDLTIN